MTQITKLSGLAVASIILMNISACTKKSAKTSSQGTAIEQKETHVALRNEIQKMLHREKHDPIALKESLRNMTWEEVNPIFLELRKQLEETNSQKISDETRVYAVAKLKITLNQLDIERSKRRSKKALKDLEKGLQEMAEKEGHTSK